MWQRKKHGLIQTLRYDDDADPETYYKSKIVALIKKYGEVTYSIIQKEIPGAYDYLKRNHQNWLREHLTKKGETAEQCIYTEYAMKKIKEVVPHIIANPPKRLITYGYIESLTGLKHEYLRSSKPRIRACLEGVVETREDWFRRRMKAAYFSKSVKDRPFTTFTLCRAASINWDTFVKYRELFEKILNELNANIYTP